MPGFIGRVSKLYSEINSLCEMVREGDVTFTTREGPVRRRLYDGRGRSRPRLLRGVARGVAKVGLSYITEGGTDEGRKGTTGRASN